MKSIKQVLVIVAVLSVLALSCASSGGGGGGGGASAEAAPVNPVYSWSFDDPAAGAAGWAAATDKFWDYKGTATVSRDDTTLGKPMLKVELDYSQSSSSEWSEPKIEYVFSEPLDLSTVTRFNYDFYYNPSYAKSGTFKGKVIAMEGGKERITGEVDYLKDADAGNGWMKAKVSIRLKGKVSGKMESTVLGIVGYRTNYKGPVLLDNIYWD